MGNLSESLITQITRMKGGLKTRVGQRAERGRGKARVGQRAERGRGKARVGQRAQIGSAGRAKGVGNCLNR